MMFKGLANQLKVKIKLAISCKIHQYKNLFKFGFACLLYFNNLHIENHYLKFSADYENKVIKLN